MQPVRHPHEPDDPKAGRAADPSGVADPQARRPGAGDADLRTTVSQVGRQLAEAERLLDSAHEQRKELAARLKQAERDLRTARQGEHAEARRRNELEEDVGATQREAEERLAALQLALSVSEQRVQELEDELLRTQRVAAELQHTVAAARARGVAVAPGGDGGTDERVAAELAARLEDLRLVEERLAAGREALDDRRGSLESRLLESEAVAGELEQQLVEEREERRGVVRALEAERESAAAETTLLQHELDRRLQVQAAVAAQLVELRDELERTQSRVATDERRRTLAEKVLKELGTTALQLRAQLKSLDEERLDLQRQRDAALAQVAERDDRLAEHAATIAAGEQSLAALRLELHEATIALRAAGADTALLEDRLDTAEQALAHVEHQAADLTRLLDGERRDRTQVEGELRVRLAEERDAFATTADGHRAHFEAAIAAERAAFEEHAGTVRDGVAVLRARLASAEADITARLHGEQAAREDAERRAAAEREGRATALAELHAQRRLVAGADAERAQRDAEMIALRDRVARAERDVAAAQTLATDERSRAAAAAVEARTAAVADLEAAQERIATAEQRAQHAEHQIFVAEQQAFAADERAGAAERRLEAAEQTLEDLRRQTLVLQSSLEDARAEAAAAVADARAQVREAQAAADVAIAAARAHFSQELAAAAQRAERAESERDSLVAELGTLEPDDDVKGALVRLRSELERVRTETAERAAREAQLESLVGQLTASASALKDGFARELEAMAAERDVQLAAEREHFSAQLVAVEQRVTEMREYLASAGSELGRQLAAERAAREAAEQQLDEVRGLAGVGAVDPEEVSRLQVQLTAEQQSALRAEERIVELEDELERARIALRPPLPAADHPALRATTSTTSGSASGDPDSVIIDLARAAARLRLRRDDAAADALNAPVEVPSPPPAGAPAPSAAQPPGQTPAAHPESSVDAASVMLPAAGTGDLQAALSGAGIEVHPGGASEGRHEPREHAEVEIGPRSDSADPRQAKAWLTTALMAEAGRDPATAARLLQALVPVQAARLRRDLAYDLVVADQPAIRVALRKDGTGVVGPVPATDDDTADFRLAGSAGALAPLFGGGLGRRLPEGIAVSGRRRRARRLTRAMRHPVELSTVAEADVGLSTVQLLTLLTSAIDPAVTAGERFTVTFGDSDGSVRAHVVIADTLPVGVLPGLPPHAAASLRTEPGTLAAFLAGNASARVSGDVSAVGRLLAWADAAQGFDA